MEENRPSLKWGVVKGIGSGQSRAVKMRDGKSLWSFVLRTYIVGGREEKKLHID